jgi:hypothetical protein
MIFTHLARCRLAAISLAIAALTCGETQAGPLFDWLFHRWKKPEYTFYTPVSTSPAATTDGACGAGVCQQTVVQYVPQTAYRTVWAPVPVTEYKTTTTYNPATGLPITCTRPCVSYTYQARRVPYTTYRPVLAQVPLASAPTTYTGVAQAGYQQAVPAYTPGNVLPGGTDCNCAVPAVTPSIGTAIPSVPAPGTTPYPASPSSSYPSATPYATPWTPVEPGTGGAANAAPAGSSDPSQQAPSLPPNYPVPGADSPYYQQYPAPPEVAEPPDAIPAAPSPPGSAAPQLESPSPPPAGSSSGGAPPINSPTGGTGDGATSIFRLRPVPDLDRRPDSADEAPRLLDPRDRTAVRPTYTASAADDPRWTATPIHWSRSAASADRVGAVVGPSRVPTLPRRGPGASTASAADDADAGWRPSAAP